MRLTPRSSLFALAAVAACFSVKGPTETGGPSVLGIEIPTGPSAHPYAPVAAAHGCPAAADGEAAPARRALLVGATKSPSGPALNGAAADVEAVYTLLTGEGGYGFDPAEVCVLLDDAASVAAVTGQLERLRDSAAEGETVLLYFAGAGAQVADDNQDEPDQFDEALALSDGLLLDDTLAGFVRGISAKTPSVTLVIDASANPGEAEAAADGASRVVRFASRDSSAQALPEGKELTVGDGHRHWTPTGLPELVVLSASQRGAAIELDGRGVFTKALVGAMAAPNQTYASLSRVVPPLVAADSQQVPGFDGDLSRLVLDASERDMPVGWTVNAPSKDGPVSLEGIQLPGFSKGALLRVFPATIDAEGVKDAANALGVVKVDSFSGFSAQGSFLLDEGQKRPKLTGGELAVLLQPGEDVARIQVRLRTGERPFDLRPAQAEALKELVAADPLAANVIEFVDSGGFEVGRQPPLKSTEAMSAEDKAKAETLTIRGPEGTTRNVVSQGESMDSAEQKIVANLLLHARQKALLNVQGDPGTSFANDQTLQVTLLAGDKQPPCADGVWLQAEPNQEQIIPLCTAWVVHVKVDPNLNPEAELNVGGVILSNDGAILGFPADGVAVKLKAGEEHTFRLTEGGPAGVIGRPPLSVTEHVMVYGTQGNNALDYRKLSQAATRDVGAGLGALLMDTASGSRDVSTASAVNVGDWTSTHLTYRVEANTHLRPEALAADPGEASRELTLNGFDITPFLPRDTNSYLYKILMNTKYLAEFDHPRNKEGDGAVDGIPYAQCIEPVNGSYSGVNGTSRFKTTDWTGGGDASGCWRNAQDPNWDDDELSKGPGIDCSTTMWYVMTRACKGDTSQPVASRADWDKNVYPTWRKTEAGAGAKKSWESYQKWLYQEVVDKRQCLLHTDEYWRYGYVSTGAMFDRDPAKPTAAMHTYYDSCLGKEFRTGDILVTRKGSGGHTYMVIDPENFVVFGSHGGDTDPADVRYEEDAEYKDLFTEYLNEGGEASVGTEYQFLTWNSVRTRKQTDEGDAARWEGFASESLMGCWRHKEVAKEWEENPESRPRGGDLGGDTCFDAQACKAD
ncbi:MAG: caspase family protein [Alphaproteobacteria bacterium]|nr:caspase family protein [Alphaproteobacteria bacterium]